jgi:hypothetical protein
MNEKAASDSRRIRCLTGLRPVGTRAALRKVLGLLWLVSLALFASGLRSFSKVCRIRTVRRRACLHKYTDG